MFNTMFILQRNMPQIVPLAVALALSVLPVFAQPLADMPDENTDLVAVMIGTDANVLAAVRPDTGDILTLAENLHGREAPHWSPDGNHIAHLGTVEEAEEVQVFVVSTDGTQRQLTFSRSFPVYRVLSGWHPDNLAVLVVEGRTAEGQNLAQLIYLPIDGSQPRVLLEVEDHLFAPAFSPDGETLAYAHSPIQRRAQADLTLLDMETGETRVVAPIEPVYPYILWSPDGSRLVFNAEEDDLPASIPSLYDLESDTVERLQADPDTESDPRPSMYPHAWSPDGMRMLVNAYSRGVPQTYILTVDTGEMQLVGTNTVLSTWSPDGRTVAYIMGNALYLWQSDDFKVRQLLSDEFAVQWWLEWRPAPSD